MTKEAPIPNDEKEATQTYAALIRHLRFGMDSSLGKSGFVILPLLSFSHGFMGSLEVFPFAGLFKDVRIEPGAEDELWKEEADGRVNVVVKAFFNHYGTTFTT